jgi:uncharacterized protein YpmB|tara:strand:- start:1611 stop:1739 length:129 start_codon:yes stop_codon:yes gene_type:complete
MKKKNIIAIVILLAVVGVVFYMFQKPSGDPLDTYSLGSLNPS